MVWINPYGSSIWIIGGGCRKAIWGLLLSSRDRTVNELIASKFPVSLELGCYAMTIALGLGLFARDYRFTSTKYLVGLPPDVFGDGRDLSSDVCDGTVIKSGLRHLVRLVQRVGVGLVGQIEFFLRSLWGFIMRHIFPA